MIVAAALAVVRLAVGFLGGVVTQARETRAAYRLLEPIAAGIDEGTTRMLASVPITRDAAKVYADFAAALRELADMDLRRPTYVERPRRRGGRVYLGVYRLH